MATLMDDDAWRQVGLPMLLDMDGEAVFIYAPPSLRDRKLWNAVEEAALTRMAFEQEQLAIDKEVHHPIPAEP